MTTNKTREQIIMRPLLDFFSHDANFKQLLEVVVFKTRNLPLRVLDWFVTNYAKKNDICYNIKRPNGHLEVFRAYRSYRAQLKGHKKKEFDPFCRGDPIVLEYESPTDGQKVAFETAICQLRFFKWAIENLVLDYIETHFDIIYTDMRENDSSAKKKDAEGTRRKKKELSKSIYQQIHVSKHPVTFNFSHTQELKVQV